MDGVHAVPALRSEPARLRAAGTADQVGGIKRHTRCASSSEGVRTALLFRRTRLVRGVADVRDHTFARGNVPLRSHAAGGTRRCAPCPWWLLHVPEVVAVVIAGDQSVFTNLERAAE